MTGDRFPDLGLVEEYLRSGVPAAIAVAGTPAVTFLVSPDGPRLGIRVAADGPEPDIESYRHIEFDTLLDGGATVQQIMVLIPHAALEETYLWLVSLVDRIQASEVCAGDALSDSLDALDELLARTSGMSIERQIGLFGELLFLAGLVSSTTADDAIGSWLGPDGGEHDFGLAGMDIEVKSTVRERRLHWITSATQLVPSPNRDLLVLSIQLTAAGPHSGTSLPELVETVGRGLQRSEIVELETKLDAVGYSSTDQHLYARRWAVRSTPVFFKVDDGFPAVTKSHLGQAVPSSERVVDFRYLLDLDGMKTETVDINLQSLWRF